MPDVAGRGWLFGALLSVVVLAAIGAGLVVIGSPEEERARRLDTRRVEQLTDIARSVDLFWTREGHLPASLEALRPVTGANLTLVDPDTGAAYGYRVVEAATYELCADFHYASEVTRGVRDGNWTHGSGRHCFTREARTLDAATPF